MAQTNYTPIQLYYSSTAAAVPLAANLAAGELAINTTDGKLYYKSNAGVVTLIASSAGASGDVVGPASATDNALARFDLTTGKLIQNSVGILSDAGILTGLTGLTSSGSITLSSLTSGRVTYAGTAGLLQDSANLTFDGTTLSAAGLSDSGNLTFTGTGNRITGDMTNATPASRVAFQTSTTNGFTAVTAIPNGTSNVAGYYSFNSSSDPANSSFISIRTATAFTGIDSNILGTGTYLPMTFSTGGSERMRLDTSGNVGIGTSSPGAKLTVKLGNIGIDQDEAANQFFGAAGNVAGTDTTGGVLTVFGHAPNAFGDTSNPPYDGTNFVGAAGLMARGFSESAQYRGSLEFFTKTASTTNATSRMIITHDGNVGIGTTTPSRALTVYTTAASDNNVLLRSGAANAYLTFADIGTTDQTGLSVRIGSSGNGLVFQTGGTTTRMAIDSSGNVGIGVTPSAWNSAYKVLDVSNWGAIVGEFTTQGSTTVATNCYANSTGYNNWTFKNNAWATRYKQNDGIHSWLTSTASGTAGNAVTFNALMTLNTNGALALFGGSTSANGVGITFPATQSASTNANTLDDYEEGTWTPALVGFTTSGTLTLTGSYIKIGRLVTLTWRLQSTVSITSAVSSTLTGIPFPTTTPGTGTSGISGAGDAGMNQLVNDYVYFTKISTSADWIGTGFYYTAN
jgi:hypothetical protein